MFRYVAVVVVVCFSLTVGRIAAAQSIASVIDLDGFGKGHIEVFAVEADGRPETQEWLLQGSTVDSRGNLVSTMSVAVQVSTGAICFEPWFEPNLLLLTTVRIVRVFGLDKLLISPSMFLGANKATLVNLDVVRCR